MNSDLFSGQPDIPRRACVFGAKSKAQFVDDDKGGKFSLTVYDGGVTNHWYWGNFAIDLQGVRFSTNPTPVLESHFTDCRIGVTTSQTIESAIKADGKFLKNKQAQELRTDMLDGFPMQASLAGTPIRIEQVEDGATTEVNGRKLKGPGAIWRQSEIYEISMTAFGALKNTRSAAFTQDDTEVFTAEVSRCKETIMAQDKKTTMTVESIKGENPDLYDQIFAAGKKEATESLAGAFSKIREAAGDNAELAVLAFSKGWSTEQTAIERAKRAEAEVVAMKKRSSPSEKESFSGVSAATQEFIEQKPPKESGSEINEFNETTATEEQLKQHYAATPALHNEFDTAGAYLAAVAYEKVHAA